VTAPRDGAPDALPTGAAPGEPVDVGAAYAESNVPALLDELDTSSWDSSR
jgi:hypothetical protein